MDMKKKKIIIIGAGPSGLSAGYEILNNSNEYEVCILEESNELGGISKTIKYRNNRMDLGGHRFFTKIDRVNDFWNKIMPVQGEKSFDDIILNKEKNLNIGGPNPEKTDDVRLVRQRVSRIYYLKKFFNYPVSLTKSTIKSLGFKNTIECGFSYLKSIVIKENENSLENFYINRFGKKLYSMFFEKYTEKLWGRHPKDISAEWGSQRVKGLSIVGVITNALKINKKKETSLISEFTYPKYGPGSLWEKVGKEIQSMKGEILLNHKVEKINIKDNKIVSVECINNGTKKIIKGDIFISSMPLKDLILSINNKVSKKVLETAKGLPYRDFITIGVLVKKLYLKNETNIPTLNNIIPDCWIYVQEENVKMGRIQIFNNWSPYMVKDPNNTIWIGLEYFCNENDDFWNKKDKDIKDYAINELITMGIIDNDDVLDYHVEKVKKAYPAYFDTYKDIDILRNYVDSYINLYCIGRNGQHRYNNMDHSVMTGFLTADHILGKIKSKEEIWNVNTEDDYHEEETKKKINYSKLFNWGLFIIYALVTLFILSKHEPWRDEAQGYLMIKEMNILELFKNAYIEGHPILWHVLMKPFINIGISYDYLSIISWSLTLISAYIVIFKLELNKLLKIMLLCSYHLIYIAPAYFRSYSLVVLMLLLMTLLYKDRYKYPIIYGTIMLLSCNIHLFLTGFVGVLFLFELYDFIKEKTNKKRIILIIFSVIGLLLFMIQIRGSGPSYFKINILSMLLNILISSNNIIATIISFITLIIFGIILYRTKNIRLFMLFMLLTMVQISLDLIKSLSYISELYIFILLFIYINSKKIKNKIMIPFIIVLLIQIIFYSVNNVLLDIKYPYSDARKTANYIKENIPKGSKIYCTNTSYCSSLIPYLNDEYDIIDTYTNNKISYIKWIEYYKYDRTKKVKDDGKYKYYIEIKDYELKELKNYKIIYKSSITVDKREAFYIIKK